MRFLLLKSFFWVLLVAVFFTACENPLKEEKKKEPVRILVEEYLDSAGKYFIFWNGKNDEGNFVPPGKYIYALEIKDWQDQDYVEVLAGGKIGQNNDAHFEAFISNYDQLLRAYPDPFQVQSGVNIPLILKAPAFIKLSIYKD
jgi:hypothetical protein